MHKDNTYSVKPIISIRKIVSFAAVAIAALMLACALGGCAPQNPSANQEEQTISAAEYMVKLNQAATSLHEGLDEFSAAVTDGDLSTLQSKSDTAFQAMDALSDLKTPEELNDVKNKYKEATDALHSSLNDYISLFVTIQSDPNPATIPQKKYAEDFEKIQKEYDRGLNLLEQADSAAKEI